MSRHTYRRSQDQARVAVLAQTGDSLLKSAWYGALAAAFTGLFYFFGAFTAQMVGRVLAGG